MSVWKKASKAHQKVHRERHQPEERKHLGLLEKKKDYVSRARDYNEKKETLKLLQNEPEDSPEQIQLMRTQNLKYIITKRTQELKKIDKLQAQLHLSSVELKAKNKQFYFDKNMKKDAERRKLELLGEKELPDLDLDNLVNSAKKRKAAYSELAKRINREKELTIIQQKIEMSKAIENKKSILPPKRVKKGTKDRAPIYIWKYERKK
ncbi:hypothetical protein NQ314_007358 [Rhamnusium bicolor]|uniref:Probable U3 small nucleolar RNA-associated protein 11 n=1 Tax=Rhamnusium bicolor TaxID=1586634 RepID=A0AAV8YNI3_9CUCU|nr:hypothetical protein NQ314_007358 [Rhamnusium bicolor]